MLVHFHERTFPDPTADEYTVARNPHGLFKQKTISAIVNCTVTMSLHIRRISPPLIFDIDRRHLDFSPQPGEMKKCEAANHQVSSRRRRHS